MSTFNTNSVAAGLPNIVGTEQFDGNQNGWLSGAFTVLTTKGNGPSGGGTDHKLDFNAANCSDIYGKSTTVTPLSRKCRFFIRYK